MIKSPAPSGGARRVRAYRVGSVGRPDRYERSWDLPRLLPLWPHEIADLSLAGRQQIMARLRQALRAERQRGIGGHWTYDLARHTQLLAAYRREMTDLAQVRAALRPSTRVQAGYEGAAAAPAAPE